MSDVNVAEERERMKAISAHLKRMRKAVVYIFVKQDKGDKATCGYGETVAATERAQA